MATIGAVVDGKSFSWDKGVGVAEISDFKGHEHVFFGPLFDDACDQGFRCVGRDGGIIPFYLDHKIYDASGEDLYGWQFVPMQAGLRDAGVAIILLND